MKTFFILFAIILSAQLALARHPAVEVTCKFKWLSSHPPQNPICRKCLQISGLTNRCLRWENLQATSLEDCQAQACGGSQCTSGGSSGVSTGSGSGLGYWLPGQGGPDLTNPLYLRVRDRLLGGGGGSFSSVVAPDGSSPSCYSFGGRRICN